jgi:hypothetical protein
MPGASRNLAASVLAARSSSATVLAFKASVDELSRLACARAQDAELLKQLEEQLPKLEPEVAVRLLTECRFRDEWRDEQCERALTSMPDLSAHDSDAVERMQEYVALLAPQSEDEDEDEDVSPDGAQTWQRELMRQQRAVSSMLTVCTGSTPDRVHDVLADFMEHSRARLHEQLACVHEQLVEANGERGHPTDGPSPRRQAWGDAAQGCTSEGTSSTEAHGPGAKAQPQGFRGLSADEFVEQLRGKHRAVCCIQANGRARQQRRRYQRIVHERLGAAVRLQCCSRQHAARRAATERRHLLWLVQCDAVSRRYNARRLQRAWRFVRTRRRWQEAWCASLTKRLRKEDALWRLALATATAERPAAPTGFSQYSVYTESRVLQSERDTKQAAGRRLQAAVRGLAARRGLRREAHAARVLQAAARRWRARKRHAWWRRALRTLHDRRRAQHRWRAARASALALQPLQTHAVLVHLNVSKELARVQSEAKREKSEFEAAFKKWAVRMERQTLAKKLHADWIPQMNVERGESYFFNVRTGESSEEHPNMRQVRATERKQRQLAEAQMAERLERLRDYEALLHSGERAHLREYSEAAAGVLVDAVALRLPAASAQWVHH